MDSLLRFMGSRVGTDDVNRDRDAESAVLSPSPRVRRATCQALRPKAPGHGSVRPVSGVRDFDYHDRASDIPAHVEMPAHGLLHGPTDGVTARSMACSEELDVFDEGMVEQRELDAKLDLLRPLVP